jgi:Cu+-exporting ATPase
MLDYSFVTGESQIIASQIGEVIYAGAKQTQGAIEIVASHSVSQSYLNSLWNKNRNASEAIKEKFEDILSQYFSLLVFLLGLSAGVYWYFNNEMQLMWNAMTTVFIIACPCALLLATNFTNGNIMRLLNLWGMYLKNADVLSQIQEIKHFVFDKTGTITHHHDDQISFEGALLKDEEINDIAAILWQSKHPIAQAVFQFLKILPNHGNRPP